MRCLESLIPWRKSQFRPRLTPHAAVLERYRSWISLDAYPQQALTGLLVLVHCLRPVELRSLKVSDLRPPDELEIGRTPHQTGPTGRAALDLFLAWRAGSYSGRSRYLLISGATA